MMKRTKKVVSLVMLTGMLSFSMMGSALAAPAKDTQGHWAEETIQDWVQKGWIEGYSDGSVKPDRTISRIELVVLVNKAFQFEGKSTIHFTDVSEQDWFYNDLQKASAAGYILGYEDGSFKPNQQISRQEIAVIISRILKLSYSSSADAFSDTKISPDWSKGSIGAVIDAKIISGYENAIFGPERNATRAETVVILDRSSAYSKIHPVVTKTYDKAGTFGSVDDVETIQGDVIVKAAGVTLQNMKITGSLLLDEAVGNGDVFIHNVTVQGTVSVNGGGSNSIHFKNSQLNQVHVNKAGGNVRVVVEGSTTVTDLDLQSGATIESTADNGKGVKNLTLTNKLPKDAKVRLSGSYERVSVDAPGVSLDVSAGSIQELSIDSRASDSSIHLNSNAKVGLLVVGAASRVTGNGAIDKAKINAQGANIEPKPGQVEISSGITAKIAGKDVKSGDEDKPAVGGGSPSDNSPGGANPGDIPGGDTDNTLNPDSVFSAGTKVKAGANAILQSAPASNVTAWFAPSGTTSFNESGSMTKLVGDGAKNTIQAPTVQGSYYLYLVDAQNKSSKQSTAVLQVDSTAPIEQDSIFSISQTVKPGTSITLASAPASGTFAWFAPEGTTNFTAGTNMTKLTGNGTAKTIQAPTAELTYKLYVLDDVGNISQGSVKTLTVDGTAPTTQNTLFNSETFKIGGKVITLASAPAAGEKVWLAPQGTTQFTAGATMTSLVGDGNLISIGAPQVEGDYRLYVQDITGNVSSPSTAILHVDNTAPTNLITVFAVNVTTSVGDTVSLTLDAGITAWFAPAVTELNVNAFTASSTMTSLTGTGNIAVPTTPATYKLFLIDRAGNVSAPSQKTLTVN